MPDTAATRRRRSCEHHPNERLTCPTRSLKPTRRRGAPAAPRPRRRGPLARRRLRGARPLLRRQPAGLPHRVRRACAGRRYRPAALCRRVARHPGRAERGVGRGRGAPPASRPPVAPPRSGPALLRSTPGALGGTLLAQHRQPLARGDARRRGGPLVARGESRPGSTAPRRRQPRTPSRPPTTAAQRADERRALPRPRSRRGGRRSSRRCSARSSPPRACSASSRCSTSTTSTSLSRLAAGVAIVGVAIAFGAMTQRRVGGLVFLGLILLAAFGVAAATPVSVSSGVGEKIERPESVTALEPSYELGIGELDLDLGAVSLPSGTTSVDASVGIGNLVITVPRDVALEIDAHAGVGEVERSRRRDDGVDAQKTITVAGSTPGRAGARRRGGRRHRQHRSAARLSSTSYRLPLALPRLRRAEGEGALAGVCAGIAKSLRVDATLVRLTFALLAFAGGAGIAAYGGAWLALAPESGAPPSQRRRLLGYVALALAGAIALRGFGFSDSLIWPAALCGAGILLARGHTRCTVRGRPLARGDRSDRVRRPERDVERPRRILRVEHGRDRAPADARAVGLAARRRAGRRAHRPDPHAGARRDGRSRARLRPADARARPARGGRPAPRCGTGAPAGARAAFLALPRSTGCRRRWARGSDRRRRGRGRGAARRPGRARPHRRRAGGRSGRGARPRRARGDVERGAALGRRPGLRLRRRRRGRDRDLRPRPRQRLRSGGGACRAHMGSPSRSAAA